MLTRVNGEKGIACLYKRRNILDCLQVIGIRTPGCIPFCGIDSTFGIVYDLLWSSACAGILTDGLLGKDWRKFCAVYCGNMTRCGKTKSVTEAERGSKSKG